MISALKRSPFVWMVALALVVLVRSHAQNPSDSMSDQKNSLQTGSAPVDHDIEAALGQVSPGHIRANIEKLTSFGTR